jgi:hypothetical protein
MQPWMKRRIASTFIIMLLSYGGSPAQKKTARLEGQYKIYAAGQIIGTEKYQILQTPDAVTTNSVLEFRNPGGGPKKISIETKLEMNGNYAPRAYELTSDVDGQKGRIQGQFSPNQVIFEYINGGRSQRSGLLLGDHPFVLDTNIFHQFLFLTRQFKYGGGATPQNFEVVIPQEKETGVLKIRELGKEDITVNGKKYSTTHLRMDSDALQIHVWVDGNRIPRKIAVPGRQVEVLLDAP